MNKLQEMLFLKQDMLRGCLKESKVIEHPVGNGDNSEGAWKQFFKKILPKKYGVDNGFVIDSEGNVSDQIDLIIYDDLYSPYIMSSGSELKYIPAEAVYAVIEIKPCVNKAYLEYANKKIESVKKLKRTSRGVTVAGVRKPKPKLTNIIGVFLASESKITCDTVKNHLKTYDNINLVCSLDEFTLLCERANENITFQKASEKEALLGLYFYLNNELYELGTVAGIDIREYANSLESFNFNTEEDFRTNE